MSASDAPDLTPRQAEIVSEVMRGKRLYLNRARGWGKELELAKLIVANGGGELNTVMALLRDKWAFSATATEAKWTKRRETNG